MPRYQPPIITGGTRSAPTWSELASYYLPQQQGRNTGPIPMLSDGTLLEQYRSMINRPLQPAQNRGTIPTPWSGGGSSYEEIMRRLEGGRAVLPNSESTLMPQGMPTSSPTTQQPPVDTGQPTTPMGGSRGEEAPGRGRGLGGGGGSNGAGAWGGGTGGGPTYSGMPGFLQGPGVGYTPGSFDPSGGIPGVSPGYGGQSALGWNVVDAGNPNQQGIGQWVVANAPGILAQAIAGYFGGPAGALIARQVMNRREGDSDGGDSGGGGGRVFSRLDSALNMFRSGRK